MAAKLTQQEQEFYRFLLSKLSDCRFARFMGVRRAMLIGRRSCSARENPFKMAATLQFLASPTTVEIILHILSFPCTEDTFLISQTSAVVLVLTWKPLVRRPECLSNWPELQRCLKGFEYLPILGLSDDSFFTPG